MTKEIRDPLVIIGALERGDLWRWEEALRGTLVQALAEVREKTGAMCLEGVPASDG